MAQRRAGGRTDSYLDEFPPLISPRLRRLGVVLHQVGAALADVGSRLEQRHSLHDGWHGTFSNDD
jgi:hypothetical protein